MKNDSRVQIENVVNWSLLVTTKTELIGTCWRKLTVPVALGVFKMFTPLGFILRVRGLLR